MAEWSKKLINQIQVENTVALVPGSNTALTYMPLLEASHWTMKNNMKSTHMSGTGVRKQYMEDAHRGHHEFVTCICL